MIIKRILSLFGLSNSNTITCAEFGELTDKKQFKLIDVREVAEFKRYNIGAINLPLSTFKKQIKNKNYSHEDFIIVHCAHGSRSRMAQKIMEGLGFKNVYNLTGGIEAYRKQFGK